VACETICTIFTFFTFFQNPKKTWLFTFFWVVAHVFPNSEWEYGTLYFYLLRLASRGDTWMLWTVAIMWLVGAESSASVGLLAGKVTCECVIDDILVETLVLYSAILVCNLLVVIVANLKADDRSHGQHGTTTIVVYKLSVQRKHYASLPWIGCQSACKTLTPVIPKGSS